jgi:hypothetical protein
VFQVKKFTDLVFQVKKITDLVFQLNFYQISCSKFFGVPDLVILIFTRSRVPIKFLPDLVFQIFLVPDLVILIFYQISSSD